MRRLLPVIPLLLLFTFSFAQKPFKPSGTWIEYRREGSNGLCFDAEGKRIPYNLVLELKSKNIVLVKKGEDDAGTPYTYTQQDSTLQLNADEKLIFSGEDYCKYTGYKNGGNTYTCYFIEKGAYKKLSEAKRSSLSFPNEDDMRYKSKITKEKKAKETQED